MFEEEEEGWCDMMICMNNEPAQKRTQKRRFSFWVKNCLFFLNNLNMVYYSYTVIEKMNVVYEINCLVLLLTMSFFKNRTQQGKLCEQIRAGV